MWLFNWNFSKIKQLFDNIAESSNGSQRLRRGLAIGDETTDFGFMFGTYIIKSEIKDWYYIGHALNVENRLKQHNAGRSKATKPYRPFKLVYCEEFETKSEAFKRDQQIKRYKHGEAFKKLIDN